MYSAFFRSNTLGDEEIRKTGLIDVGLMLATSTVVEGEWTKLCPPLSPFERSNGVAFTGRQVGFFLCAAPVFIYFLICRIPTDRRIGIAVLFIFLYASYASYKRQKAYHVDVDLKCIYSNDVVSVWKGARPVVFTRTPAVSLA